MITGKTGGYAIGDWLAQLPRWIMIRTAPALLLFAGVARATPISSADYNAPNTMPATVRMAGSDSFLKATTGFKYGETSVLSLSDVATYASSEPSAEACAFSSNCYTRIRVPEPQSLLLVGSGLLSMAGLIRRRLIR